MQLKRCNKCKKRKRLSLFSLVRRRNRNGKLYRDGNCKRCKADWMKADRIKNPDRYTDHDLRQLYGITVEQYAVLNAKQNGVCAICGKPEPRKKKRLHVDHCHRTGKIRGLLCGNCNTAIGKLGEDVNVLKAAIRYIESGDAR